MHGSVPLLFLLEGSQVQAPLTLHDAFSIPGYTGGKKHLASTPFAMGAVVLSLDKGRPWERSLCWKDSPWGECSWEKEGPPVIKEMTSIILGWREKALQRHGLPHTLWRGPEPVLLLIPGPGEGGTGWVCMAASRSKTWIQPGSMPLPGATTGCTPARASWCFWAGAEEAKLLISTQLLPKWTVVSVTCPRPPERDPRWGSCLASRALGWGLPSAFSWCLVLGLQRRGQDERTRWGDGDWEMMREEKECKFPAFCQQWAQSL